jgi:Protein of unknown function (DUF3761)
VVGAVADQGQLSSVDLRERPSALGHRAEPALDSLIMNTPPPNGPVAAPEATITTSDCSSRNCSEPWSGERIRSRRRFTWGRTGPQDNAPSGVIPPYTDVADRTFPARCYNRSPEQPQICLHSNSTRHIRERHAGASLPTGPAPGDATMVSNEAPQGRAPVGRRPDGMRIGPVPFLGALVFAVLILIPGTRSLGLGLMVLLGIPIFIGWIRARRLTDGSRGLTSVNAVICGLMVLVGAAMSPTADPTPIPTQTATIAAPRTTAPREAQPSAPPAAAEVSAPASSAVPTTRQAPPAAVHQPVRAPVPRLAEVAPSTKHPTATPRTKSNPPAAGCADDSYTNSSGHCVHRPEAAPSAPQGASAKCKDGTYSFSEHRRGTCSGHGGVANWL